jgi:hypothetical protein
MAMATMTRVRISRSVIPVRRNPAHPCAWRLPRLRPAEFGSTVKPRLRLGVVEAGFL